MPNSPKKIKKQSDWIEFQTKIVYLYEKLFKSNIKDLAEAFSQNSLKGKELYGREKSMKNWLNGHIKKPNKFDLSLYQIGEYYLDKEALFCEDSFKFWGIERFKHRVDMYLNQTLIKTPTQLLYIYFFSPDEEKILYHTLRKDSQDDNYFILNLRNESKHFYVSEYLKHDNTIYIVCESNFDKRFYIFEEENTIAKVRLLGTEICRDFVSKKPRSSLVLLSSSKLGKVDEMKCRHKLNQSNLLIAKPFPHKLKREDEFLYQNFNHKINKLKFDLSLISQKSLKQYFVQHLFAQFDNINKDKNTFHISLGDYFTFLAFDWLPKDKKIDIKWVFNLNYSMFWLISEKVTHPILTAHRKLAQMGFDIEYIIILRDDKKELKKTTINRLREFESFGIKISITYPDILDNQFLLINNFSMLMNSSNSMETTISLDEKSIKNFKEQYQKIKAKAISVEDFSKKNSHLDGHWYIYSPWSAKPLPNYSAIELNIDYPNFTLKCISKKIQNGTLIIMAKQILFILEDTVLKIDQNTIKEKIFPISIISNVQRISHKKLLTFAIMTKELLSDNNVVDLLKELTQEPHILNVNDEFYPKVLKLSR